MKPSLSSCEAIVIPTEPLCGLTVPIKTQRVPLYLYRKSSHIYFQFVLKKEKGCNFDFQHICQRTVTLWPWHKALP